MYRLSASDRLQEITVTSIPHMKKEAAEEVIATYRSAANDIMDVLEPATFDNVSKLKQVIGHT